MASNGPTRDQDVTRRSYSDRQLGVLRAFTRRWKETDSAPVETAAVAGKGPFSRGKIWSYLGNVGVRAKKIGDIDAPELLVVGRKPVEDFEKHAIQRLLKRRRGEKLRICSQEMLLAWSMTGIDPNKRPQTVETFIEGHPALTRIKEQLSGRWPGTDIIPSDGDGEGDFSGPDKSPLKRLGYSVGKSGKPRSIRRRALRDMYNTARESLPGKYSEAYLNEWGPAESGARLRRMANHIASNCRTFKRRDRSFDLAIDHSESDLQWLKQKYYSPLTYGFEWPSTAA